MTIEVLEARINEAERDIQNLKLQLEVVGIEKAALEKLITKLEGSIEDVKTMFHDSRELILLHEKSVDVMEEDLNQVADIAKGNQKTLTRFGGALAIIIPVATFLIWVLRSFVFGA